MYYELYLDRMFLLHFPMHFLLLSLTAVLLGCRPGKWRLIWTSALQTFCFLIIFIMPSDDVLWLIKMFLLSAGSLGCLWLAFRFDSWPSLIDSGVQYIAAAAGLGGMLTVLKVENTWYGILGAAALITTFGGLFLYQKKQKAKLPWWTVDIKNGECRIRVTALMDSGNSLYDPISQKPVCIVTRELADALKLFEKPERFRAIPYHSVGKKQGILMAGIADQMYLQKGEQRQKKMQVILAVSDQQLSASGQYQMLLHPALLDEKLPQEKKGDNHDTQSRSAGKDAV